MFAEDLAGRIFGFDSDAARVFSKIGAHRCALWRTISHADAQIVPLPSARSQACERNVADFTDCDLEVLDPWKQCASTRYPRCRSKDRSLLGWSTTQDW